MIKILFVCLGNICRSPIAECIMQSRIEKYGCEDMFEVDSAGIINYHEGEQPDRRMREHAYVRGYRMNHKSRPICNDDFETFDMIIAMDDSNYDALVEKAPTVEAVNKIHRMSEYFSKDAIVDYVPDPYYGGSQGFSLVIDLLEDSCDNLLRELRHKKY